MNGLKEKNKESGMQSVKWKIDKEVCRVKQSWSNEKIEVPQFR